MAILWWKREKPLTCAKIREQEARDESLNRQGNENN